ncbi:MAG: LytTR family DNA-binding domain-containing protein [Ignavibacteria bacterium]|nr:LytTR family DNA-binding domain-containing protein [Ignavibacteria bacterium]
MQPPIKIGLIDDEQLSLDLLNKVMKGIPGYQVVFSESDPLEGLKLARQKTCEVLITDIQMEKLNGLIISEEMEILDLPVIIYTAYKDYAISGINTSVSGYLLKPVEVLDLKRALTKASKKLPLYRQRLIEEKSNFVLLHENGFFGLSKVTYDSIFYLEQVRNYTYFHSLPKVYKERSTINEWVNKLPPNLFIQIHKSFILNLSKLDKVLNKEVILIDGKTIPIGNTFRDELLGALGK